MKALSVAAWMAMALSLSACGTVDLEADPLLKPPQLVDPDEDAEKKAAVLPRIDFTLNA